MSQGLQFSLLFSGLESLSTGDAGFAKPGQADAFAQQAAAFQQLLQDEQYTKDLRQGQTSAATMPPTTLSKTAPHTTENLDASGPVLSAKHLSNQPAVAAMSDKDAMETAYTDPSFYAEQVNEHADIEADFAGKWLGLIQQSSDANTQVSQKALIGSRLHHLQDEPLIDKLGPVPDDETPLQAMPLPLLSEEAIQKGVSVPAIARQGQADIITTQASADVLTEATGESNAKTVQQGASALSAAALTTSSDTAVSLVKSASSSDSVASLVTSFNSAGSTTTLPSSSNIATDLITSINSSELNDIAQDNPRAHQSVNALTPDSSLVNVAHLSKAAVNQDAERQVIDKASPTKAMAETTSADILAVESAAERLVSESLAANKISAGADAQAATSSVRGDVSGLSSQSDRLASASASSLITSSNNTMANDVSKIAQEASSVAGTSAEVNKPMMANSAVSAAAIATDNTLEHIDATSTKAAQAQSVTIATTSAPAINTPGSAPLPDATDAVATAVNAAENIVATGLGLSIPNERTATANKASASQKRGLDTLGSSTARVTDSASNASRVMASVAAESASDTASNNEQQGQARQDSKTLNFTKFEVALVQNGSQTTAATVNSSSTPTTEAAVSLARAEGFASVLEQQSRPQSAAVAPSLAAQLKQLNLQQQDATGQLRERVQLMIRQNVQVAEIRLDPAELGQMQIRVNLQQEQATVQFIVQQQQAKELLEQQMPKLREMLQQQGIQLGEGQVQQQARQERQSTEQHGGRSTPSGDDTQSAAEGGVINSTIDIHHSERLVDYYA
ncbi:flagellar hook-length control protein FliK [Alishewanella tabrizica]|uniref:Flagellar hook-length control protein-like C-terminal domain-containing protein n=1 Tax=Alishewanella tabrizica TaxID=671278 RepID=A0ABQ2WNZ8_9ALTE|nr:flagellar hook-length control protein FliK [Alishewanella tabrizica]GGW63192.1 hypothetical protein GCM10008111_19020 [Alishewanella tabrizica]